ncbi:MAG: sigma-70 family RNA polymerase sigma factor [Planctomycetota bacterium]
MSFTPASPDGAAPEQLLGEIQWVHALAAGLVRDDSRADDIAQETLLAALKNPPKGNVRAWMSKVLRYRQWNQLRTDQNRRSREQSVARSEALPSTSDVMERAETQRRLVEAVFALKDPYRTTVVMRYFEGMTTDQVAQQQRVEPATVRSRLRRGLEKLREQLDDEYGDRKTWCLALAPLVLMHDQAVASAISAASAVSAGAAAATTSTTTGALTASKASALSISGGLIMSTKAVTAAAVAVVILVGATMVWKTAETSQDQDREQAIAPATVWERDDSAPGAPAADSSSGRGGATDVVLAANDGQPGLAAQSVAAVDDKGTGSIVGRVADESDRPLAGMVVHAVRSNAPAELLDADLPFGLDFLGVEVPDIDDPQRRAETDRSGHFAIGELPDGTYSVVVRGPGRRQHIEKRIEVAADREASVQVQLGEGHRIEGIVVDPTGRPVADAEVAVNGGMMVGGSGGQSIMISIGGKDSGGQVKTTTDRHGRFVLDGLSSGNQTLTATHESWAPGTLADVASGSSNIEVMLKEGSRVDGVVLAPDGTPLADAAVLVTRTFGDPVGEMTTGSDGRFAFDHLPSGQLRFVVAAVGFPTIRESLQITDGEPITDLELRMEIGTAATGLVVDGAGAPVPGARVRLTVEDAHEMGAMATSDADGKFRVEGLAVGEFYQGTVKSKQHLEHDVEPFTAGKGETELGTITLARGGKLIGIVTNAAGEPVAGARVSLRPVKSDDPMAMLIDMGGLEMDFDFGMGKSGKSDDSGAFEIVAVEPGEYDIRARCSGYSTYKGGRVTIRDEDSAQAPPIVLERGFTITGRVLDPSGQPVAGATVSASAGFPDLGAKRAKSDEDGNFEIAGLDDKSYRVSAKSSNFSPATAKDISAGSTDLVLQLQKAASVSGTVVDAATGIAVSSFGIKMTPKARNFQMPDFSLDDLSSWTSGGEVQRFQDAGGVFEVGGHKPGEYTLTVTADGYIAHESIVKLKSGENAVLAISLDRGGAIEGYVRDSNGKPIKGASVIRVEAGKKKKRKHTMSIGMTMTIGGDGAEDPLTTVSSFGDDSDLMTDENGYFLLTGVPPGKVDLQIKHNKFVEGVVKGVDVVRGETRQAPPAVLERGGRIYGTVYNADGNPTQTATVLIFPIEKGKRGEPRFLMPNEKGVYSQSGLRAGEYEIDLHVIEMSGGGGIGMIKAAAGGDEEDEETEPAAIVRLAEGAEVLQDLHPTP